MSTTVTYKNNALATVNNATKTLKTAGKYMEDDITLTDVDDTLVVTVSYNNQTRMWEPDCTWAEVNAAVQAGKEIVACGPMDQVVAVDCDWNSSDGALYYIVYWTDSVQWQVYVYELTQNGISQSWDDSIRYPLGTINITASGNTDVTQYATASVPIADCEPDSVTGQFQTVNGARKWRAQSGETVYSAGWITSGYKESYATVYDAVAANTTVTPSASAQTVGGANYMMEGAVTVAAVPTGEYDIDIVNPQFYDDNGTRKWRARADMDVWDGWLPEGSYYGSYMTRNAVPANTTITPTTSAQTIGGTNYVMEDAVTVAAMPTGSAGTPTATKGSVSNHAVSVTPSVTNQTGYITGGTKTGTAISVSASELVSGTYTVDSSGTKDVTNYASASVAAGSATASATKGTVSNHSVTVTPSVTRTAGWVSAGNANGTAVTVSASELVSGTKSITANGTNIDVTNYANVDVTVDNNFAIELTYNSQTGVWEPDCTFNEAKNAFINNKNIVSSISYPGIHSSFDGYNELDDQIYYSTEEYDIQNYAYISKVYIWRSTGEINEDTSTRETRYDTTTATAIASDVANGKLFFNANGRQVGTASSGGGDSYTLTTILAQRTLNPDNQHWAEVPASDWTEAPAVGEYYLVTFDGTEYLCTGGSMWDNEVVFGDDNNLFQNENYMLPFAVDYSIPQQECIVGCIDTNQHTIKVEHFELVDGPLNLITKSITSNGTYNASSDNADGYSSVTVNVSSSGGTYQAKTNISPTTSSQTITPDSGYDALSSVQINAMPSGTAGTPSATKGSVSNHSITVTPSVTNTTGYITGSTKTGTAVTVSASELVSGSETKTANGTYNVTNLASLVVNIPIVTYHTSSSAPTSSQGSNGDLWLVTA